MVRLNTQRHKLPSTFEHCEIKKKYSKHSENKLSLKIV